MNWIIVPKSRITEMESLNTERQACRAAETQDGIFLTGSGKIGDPLWSRWQEFLLSLEQFQGDPVWKEEA